MGRWLWILANLLLGAAGGAILAWGPLDAPVGTVAGLGIAGALMGAAIGAWSLTPVRRRRVLVGHGVILAAVAVAALVPLYRIGTLPVPGETRRANFARLWRAVDWAYPYFEEKGVDWEATYARYAPQLAEIETDGEYWGLVARMLAELNDGHTDLVSPPPRAGRRHFATARDIGGEIVLDQVGATARDAGLERGDVVLAVEGVPIEQALQDLPLPLRAGSTPQQRRLVAAFNVLSTTEDTLTLTVTGPAGERTVTLVRPETEATPSTKHAASGPDGASGSDAASGWAITGERLPSGLALIRIPNFAGGSGRGATAAFDAVLDPLLDAPGLILDLRGNDGGSTLIADPIAGRFFEAAFTYGRDTFRVRLPQRGWRGHLDYRVRPRGTPYTGPVVVLIDAGVFSTGETFTVALVDSGRATTVGRPTAGGTGNPVGFALTGSGRARFSTGDFRRIDGTQVEGAGIQPDLPVAWTVEDFRAGRDPDLEAAERLLLGEDPDAGREYGGGVHSAR